ncbi:hypothetical protein DM02DRAFT_177786 [Periconia macrospinosa]|uniref:Uncharacterized protein n=1 Tax=Periconia macrospinosa TaxID=97972 RepID=A0A2V1E2B8_9PLEO|nr:hypothetical protein DM02DRAFT_177786 [Periconia macrospinosa]
MGQVTAVCYSWHACALAVSAWKLLGSSWAWAVVGRANRKMSKTTRSMSNECCCRLPVRMQWADEETHCLDWGTGRINPGSWTDHCGCSMAQNGHKRTHVTCVLHVMFICVSPCTLCICPILSCPVQFGSVYLPVSIGKHACLVLSCLVLSCLLVAAYIILLVYYYILLHTYIHTYRHVLSSCACRTLGSSCDFAGL